MSPSPRRVLPAPILSLLAAPLLGCIATATLPHEAPRPHPTRSPEVVRESAILPARAAVRPSRGVVEVVAASPRVCREVRVSPAVADQTTERTLTPGGWIGQFLLGASAATFLGAGIYASAEPCGVASGLGAPCVEPVTEGVQTAGTVSIVAGSVLSALFVATALGTIDTTDEIEVAPVRTAGGWQACGWAPAPGATVELRLSDGRTLWARTDARGAATIEVRPLAGAAVAPIARVVVAGTDVGTVNLTNTDIFEKAPEPQVAPQVSTLPRE